MIRTYCHDSVSNSFHSGLAILDHAAKLGDARSCYSLGLILRDGCKAWSANLLNTACGLNYLPACQEILSTGDNKDRFGDLSAATLEKFMDPGGLNRLLKQFYLNSADIRVAQTSHCWNPHCGRWAFKASNRPTLGTNHVVISTPSNVSPQETWHLRNNDMSVSDNNAKKESASKNALLSFSSIPDIDSALDSILLQNKVELYSSPFASTLFATPFDDSGISTSSSPFVSPSQSTSYSEFKCFSQQNSSEEGEEDLVKMNRVSRMKMCSSCRRAKYCSKLCQVYDWRSGRHRAECHFLT